MKSIGLGVREVEELAKIMKALAEDGEDFTEQEWGCSCEVGFLGMDDEYLMFSRLSHRVEQTEEGVLNAYTQSKCKLPIELLGETRMSPADKLLFMSDWERDAREESEITETVNGQGERVTRITSLIWPSNGQGTRSDYSMAAEQGVDESQLPF